MPSPNAVFTEIVTTTFRNHGSKIVDNVSKHNALFRKMKMRGKTRTESGGYSIVAPLEYAMNGTYQRYSGMDVLNVSQSDVFTAAEYNWRQIALNVVTSGYELRVNAGPQRIANLAKSRIQNAIHTFANNFSSDLYADGSLTNQIDGLQKLVSDAGTGTVGGARGGFGHTVKRIGAALDALEHTMLAGNGQALEDMIRSASEARGAWQIAGSRRSSAPWVRA